MYTFQNISFKKSQHLYETSWIFMEVQVNTSQLSIIYLRYIFNKCEIVLNVSFSDFLESISKAMGH